jgi:hypothetical protein
MQLITDDIRAALIANGQRFQSNRDFDPHPVVKLFTADAATPWLIASTEPEDPDVLFYSATVEWGFRDLARRSARAIVV